MLATNSTIQAVDCTIDSHLMLFDLSVGGHHPGYIQHLIQYWNTQSFPGQLSIVVLPRFMTQHADVVACTHEKNSVKFIPISSQESASLPSRSSFIRRTQLAFKEWNLFCIYAKRLRIDHGFLLYLDTAQLPIIFSQRPPCSFSGIYFRPTFHYNSFLQSQAQLTQPITLQQRLQHSREKFQLRQVLKHPKLSSLLCLDPFAVEYINQEDYFTKSNTARVLHLPDPIQVYPQSNADIQKLKQQLSLCPDRKTFLLFGALNARKGIHQLLASLSRLSKEESQKFCLLMVGPISAADRLKVIKHAEYLQQVQPLQIVIKDCFINDKDIQPYFQLADVVLAPYQKHVGMSAILVRAAAAKTPVLSSNYGLMGEMTRRYQLGITVETSSPTAISEAIKHCLLKDKLPLSDVSQMATFAAHNTAKQFSENVFQSIFSLL